jgi:hypothetical protein
VRLSDFWDGLAAFIDWLHRECTKMVERGNLAAFERECHDLIAKVSEHRWYADAKPGAKKRAERSIRIELKKMIEYYRFAGRLLDADFG